VSVCRCKRAAVSSGVRVSLQTQLLAVIERVLRETSCLRRAKNRQSEQRLVAKGERVPCFATIRQPEPRWKNTEMDEHDILKRAVAAKLQRARLKPPRVIATLLTLTSIPLLTLIGLVGTLILAYLAHLPDSAITTHWSYAFAALFAGAAFRDVGIARKVAKLWPAQQEFINWHIVDEFTT